MSRNSKKYRASGLSRVTQDSHESNWAVTGHMELATMETARALMELLSGGRPGGELSPDGCCRRRLVPAGDLCGGDGTSPGADTSRAYTRSGDTTLPASSAVCHGRLQSARRPG